jgi:hypothetical protein
MSVASKKTQWGDNEITPKSSKLAFNRRIFRLLLIPFGSILA